MSSVTSELRLLMAVIFGFGFVAERVREKEREEGRWGREIGRAHV